MEALIVEAAAYLLVLPLRALGLVGGRRVRERTRRAEWWILRQAWRIGASGVTTNTETGGGFSEDAWRSAAALKFEEEAKLNLERTTPELEGGRRRVEGRDAGGGAFGGDAGGDVGGAASAGGGGAAGWAGVAAVVEEAEARVGVDGGDSRSGAGMARVGAGMTRKGGRVMTGVGAGMAEKGAAGIVCGLGAVLGEIPAASAGMTDPGAGVTEVGWGWRSLWRGRFPLGGGNDGDRRVVMGGWGGVG